MSDQLRTFLRRPEVERITGLSTSTLYDEIAKGRFPGAIRITPGRVAWDAAAIAKWQAERAGEAA